MVYKSVESIKSKTYKTLQHQRCGEMTKRNDNNDNDANYLLCQMDRMMIKIAQAWRAYSWQ